MQKESSVEGVVLARELKNWGMLLFLSVIWGSSFILMKRGMIDKASGELIFSHQQVASLRMLVASIAMLPVGLMVFRKFPLRKKWLSLLVVGFLGNFLPAFLFTFAETGISSGFAGMLNSSTPIFTIVIGALVFSQRIVLLQLVGVLIGTIGIVWLISSVQVVSITGSLWHTLAVVLATLCYATSVNTIKYTLGGLKPLQITGLAFSFTLIPALILFFYFDTSNVFYNNPLAFKGFFPIVVLGLVGTALSVVVFNYLIANSSALFASSVTYLIPIVASFIGFLDGEPISFLQISAMFIVLMGIFIANVLPRVVKSKSI